MFRSHLPWFGANIRHNHRQLLILKQYHNRNADAATEHKVFDNVIVMR